MLHAGLRAACALQPATLNARRGPRMSPVAVGADRMASLRHPVTQEGSESRKLRTRVLRTRADRYGRLAHGTRRRIVAGLTFEVSRAAG